MELLQRLFAIMATLRAVGGDENGELPYDFMLDEDSD